MDSLATHYRKNLILATPVMLSQLGHVMVGVVDSMMVGQLGAVPLAAASLANAVFMLFFTFGIGVSYAITPLVASADGSNEPEKAGSALKSGFLINIVTAAIILLVVLLGTPILHHLDQDPAVVELAVPYLIIISISIFPFMIFQTFRQFTEGISMTQEAMYIVLFSNAVNIGLNYILIFGKLGFPAMELNGAGYATLASRVVMGGLMALLVFKHKKITPYLPTNFFRDYDFKTVKKMIQVGVPTGLQFAFEISAFGGAAILMGVLGVVQQAAHQIAINMAAISYMMASGLAASATIRVGNQLGKKDFPNLRRAVFTLYVMVLILMSIWALVFIVQKNWLPTLYISDSAVIEQAATLLIFAALFQLSDGAQVLGLGALRGLSDVKIPTLLTFIAYWVLGIPIGYLLGFTFGMGGTGIWIGLTVGLTIVAVALFLRFERLSRFKKE